MFTGLPGTTSQAIKNFKHSKGFKFRSRLTALQNRKLDNGLVTTLCTYIPRGRKYPYNSVKRGWK